MQIKQAEQEIESNQRQMEQQQHDSNLQAIETFKQKTLKGLIEKIRTLKELHVPQCTCGATGTSTQFTQDIVPQVLHNWAEATEKVDRTMKKIQEKVMQDHKEMTLKIKMKQQKIEEQYASI